MKRKIMPLLLILVMISSIFGAGYAQDFITSSSSEFAGGDGTVGDPYQISTAEQLNNVRKYLDKHFILVNDIDLSEYLAVDGAGYNDGAGWEPIGFWIDFTGTFDGNGYTISGLFINRPDAHFVGLFRIVSGATLRDVSLVNVNVTGFAKVGGLAGLAKGATTICNVSVAGVVNGEIDNKPLAENVGGLVGELGLVEELDGGTITNSSAAVVVSGRSVVGGLAGRSNGNITNSFATNAVTGFSHVGGLVGFNTGDVTNSYAKGTVTGNGDAVGGLVGISVYPATISGSHAEGGVTGAIRVGGLVGRNTGAIKDSYASGRSFSSDQDLGEVGGLVGHLAASHEKPNGTITNSYSTGEVVSDRFALYAGGLVGYMSAEKATVTSSYYDSETSKRNDNTGKGTPKTTAQMKQQATFSGWNFTNTWAIIEGVTYPYLQWQASTVPTGPVNDNFADRSVISGGIGSTSGSNVDATLEPGEPIHLFPLYHQNMDYRASVWWSWTSPDDFIADFDTIGSDFDTFMAVYTGDSLDNLVPVAANDDSPGLGGRSRVSFAAWSGVTYHIAVGGFEAEEGNISLNWSTVDMVINTGNYEHWSGNGHYYREYSINGPILWADACNLAGKSTYELDGVTYQGHLVTVNSQEEQGFLNTTFMGHNKAYWIGAYRDEGNPGSWKWVTAEEWDYSNWGTSQPSNRYYELYVYMWGHNGSWDDTISLNKITSFIVEYPSTQIITYTANVSANPEEGGTVEVGGPYEEGEEVTVIATANEGYRFVNWTDDDSDGAEVSEIENFTFDMPAYDLNYTANFEEILTETYTVTLSANPAEGGEVDGGGHYYAEVLVSINAIANEGYRFVNWTDEEGYEVINVPDFAFEMGVSDVTLTANFEEILPATYTVTVSAAPPKGGTVEGGGAYEKDEEVTVTATANDGYRFVCWTEDGVVVPDAGAIYTFTIEADRTLVAKFEAESKDKPDKPDKPEKPEDPGETEKPEKPEDPGKPDKPEKPEDPGKPEKPEKPVKEK